MKCGCGNDIEEERLELLPDTKVCCKCAHKGFGQPPEEKGAMIFDHKTGGQLIIMSADAFSDYKAKSRRVGQMSVLRSSGISPGNS